MKLLFLKTMFFCSILLSIIFLTPRTTKAIGTEQEITNQISTTPQVIESKTTEVQPTETTETITDAKVNTEAVQKIQNTEINPQIFEKPTQENIQPQQNLFIQKETIEDETAKKKAPDEEKKESKFWVLAAGISFQNAKWKFYDIRSTVKESQIIYRIQDSVYKGVEGDIYSPLIGLKAGISGSFNNNAIAKAKRLSGYLGFKNFYVRSKIGSFSGETEWLGDAPIWQKRIAKFDHKFMEIDGLYRVSDEMLGGTYIGVRYTSIQTPIEAGTLSVSRTTGQIVGLKSAFDPNFKTDFYSFMFGFDNLNASITSDNEIHKGFGFLARADDGIGFGKGIMSAEGVRAIKEVNLNKTLVDSQPTIVTVHNDTTFGIKYSGKLSYLNYVIGLGYDLYFLSIFAFPKKATSYKEISPEIDPWFLRHGPALKIFASF